MSWNFTIASNAIAKAGAYANSSIVASAAQLARWSDQVEGVINMRTRRDWITASAAANYKGALDDCASDLIAMKIIAYDQSGYSQLQEAQTILDVLRDNSNTIITELTKIEVQDKM